MGQTVGLSLASASVPAGGTASLSLSITGSTGVQPGGIQWAVGYSPADVSSITVTASAAATAAGETIACSPGAGTVMCLLYGMNSTPIPAGVVAQVNVTLSPTTTSASTSLAISGMVASDMTGSVIAATGSGGVIVIPPPVTVTGLTCPSASFTAPGSVSCTVTLSAVAPAGGFSVALSSGNAQAAVPASLSIPAGSTTGTFTATVASASSSGTAVITVLAGGTPKSASIAFLPAVTVSGVVCPSASFTSPGSVSCTITLTASAPAGGLSVAISSSNPQAAIPASLSIAAGSTTGTVTATVASASATGGAVITASGNGSSQLASIAFAPDQVSSLSCGEATVPSGSSTSCTVTLLSAAPAAGETVTLSSGNPAVTLPASVAVASGATTATFVAAAAGTAFEQVWLTASLNGSSTATMVSVAALQIQGNPSELAGSSNGSIVTPAVAPSGFTGALVVTGTGAANFAQVGNGSGVSFLNCCSNTNTAHYKFTGTELGSMFNVNQGQISFTLKSNYTFAQRQTTAAAKRYTFDVQDNVATSHHLFYFLTESTSNSTGAHLTFSYTVGGAAQFYYAPLGTEDTLYGNGVTLQVTITWNGGTSNLYLNGTLVQTETYTIPTAAWTAGSVFDLGATEYLTYGGYNSSDDLISAFTVGVPIQQ